MEGPGPPLPHRVLVRKGTKGVAKHGQRRLPESLRTLTLTKCMLFPPKRPRFISSGWLLEQRLFLQLHIFGFVVVYKDGERSVDVSRETWRANGQKRRRAGSIVPPTSRLRNRRQHQQ